MKSLEQQLHEKEQELRELRKTAVDASLTQELRESGLPDAAQARIRKRFQTAGKTDGIKAAIADEREYIRQVRGSGWKHKASASSGAAVDLVEASLVKSYRQLGLSEKEAKIAAGVESAVEDISESRQRLIDSARALGLTDEQAKHFADF